MEQLGPPAARYSEPIMMLKLPAGYHKQACFHLGSEAVAATFDSGSFRNAIDEAYLAELERKDLTIDGEKVVTARSQCEETDITGVVGGVRGSYNQVVGIRVTFKESEDRHKTKRLLFVVLRNMGSSLIIGCPSLDDMGFASSKEVIELRALDLEIPTIMPDEAEELRAGKETLAIATEPFTVHPGEVKELHLVAPHDGRKGNGCETGSVIASFACCGRGAGQDQQWHGEDLLLCQRQRGGLRSRADRRGRA